MKGNCYPNVTGPKKKQKWRESFLIFMFIANNEPLYQGTYL